MIIMISPRSSVVEAGTVPDGRRQDRVNPQAAASCAALNRADCTQRLNVSRQVSSWIVLHWITEEPCLLFPTCHTETERLFKLTD